MTVLRTGILGCGNFAHTHARIATSLPDDVELVAFTDCAEEKARAFSAQYTSNRAAVFTNHRDMFDQAGLDLVLVCLPPFGHTDEVEQAAERGIHLLIEKPIALTTEDAWKMVDAAERTGIKTQVGFMYRFGEAVERFTELQRTGEAGRAGLMSARYFCNALHADWWRMRDKSGGQVVEQAIHVFDLLRCFLGDADVVYGRQENLFHQEVEGYTIEDVSATVVSFMNGALGVVYATNGAVPGKWTSDYHVVTRNITASFTDANTATFYFTAEADKPPLMIASDRNFRHAQMLDLLRAIQTNGETRTPLREGAKTLDLVLAAARSNEQRAEVRV